MSPSDLGAAERAAHPSPFFCLHFVTFLSNLFLLGNVYIIFLDLVYVHNDVFTTFDSRAEHGPSK